MFSYIVAFMILLVQEMVLFNGLLFATHHGDYNIWIIHLFFILATILDIWIGYRAGLFAKKRVTKGRFVNMAERGSKKFHDYTGKHGRKAALFILGHFSFPYLNAFVSAWLDITLNEAMIFIFLGNLSYYIFTWLLVLGFAKIMPNPIVAFAGMVAVSVLVVFLAGHFEKQK